MKLKLHYYLFLKSWFSWLMILMFLKLSRNNRMFWQSFAVEYDRAITVKKAKINKRIVFTVPLFLSGARVRQFTSLGCVTSQCSVEFIFVRQELLNGLHNGFTCYQIIQNVHIVYQLSHLNNLIFFVFVTNLHC